MVVHCWASGMHWVAQLASAAAAGAGGRREACAKARNRNERCTDRRGGGGRRGACELQPELGCERWAAPAAVAAARAARPRWKAVGGAKGARGHWADGRLGRVRVRAGELGGEAAGARLASLAGFAPFGATQSPGAPPKFFFLFRAEKRKKKSARTPYPFLSRNLAKGAKGARRRWMPGAPPPAPSTRA